jgi:hypothetical protein
MRAVAPKKKQQTDNKRVITLQLPYKIEKYFVTY